MNRFPLDGTEGEYATVTGARSTCKARFSRETLVLETPVASTRPDGSIRRFQTREEWRLSKDLKTLTIKMEIRMPDMPPEIVAMGFPNNPRTEICERTLERRARQSAGLKTTSPTERVTTPSAVR